MIELKSREQMERAIERARQSKLVVRRTTASRMYRVENLDNGQVYTCNFYVRSSDRARFGHCTCKAGSPPLNKEGVPMYEARPCKHLAAAAALNIYDQTVRRAAAMVAQMPKAA
jgi:hypothetical protein